MTLNCGRCTQPKSGENEPHLRTGRKVLCGKNKMCSQGDRWQSKVTLPFEIPGKEGLKEEEESHEMKSFVSSSRIRAGQWTLGSAAGRSW